MCRIELIRLGYKYNILIRPNTVGYGLYIPHISGGVILNCVSIGNHCTINAGVIVGRTDKGIPTIGDNVHLAVGAKVIGNVVVGNNVVVGPNSVVVRDVEDNTVVTGIPAKFLKQTTPH